MAWMWMGVVLGFLVVVPLLLFFLDRLLRPALAIKSYADDILDHGVSLTKTLDAVPLLVTTAELTAAARTAVGRYGAAVEQLL